MRAPRERLGRALRKRRHCRLKRIRANQPATAMLYVLIITAVMGVVPAHLLFFVTGIPV